MRRCVAVVDSPIDSPVVVVVSSFLVYALRPSCLLPVPVLPVRSRLQQPQQLGLGGYAHTSAAEAVSMAGNCWELGAKSFFFFFFFLLCLVGCRRSSRPLFFPLLRPYTIHTRPSFPFVESSRVCVCVCVAPLPHTCGGGRSVELICTKPHRERGGIRRHNNRRRMSYYSRLT